MNVMTKQMTPEEMHAAAEYFASLPYKPWIKVVEADTVPRPVIHGVSAYGAAADGSREVIGDRIVELPEDEARTDLRDDASGFVAYVPPGAVGKGRALAETAEGERQPCGACHGARLEGNPAAGAPRLSGLGWTYASQQIERFSKGERGTANGPMRGVAQALDATAMEQLKRDWPKTDPLP